MTDHARQLARSLGLRPARTSDLPLTVEAAARAAWDTDQGKPIVIAVVAALRAGAVILAGAAVIERAAIAGRARARQRPTNALVGSLTEAQAPGLDGLLTVDPLLGMTSFGWIKAMPMAPKADHVGELLDRLRRVRTLGLSSKIAGVCTRTGCASWFGRATRPTPWPRDPSPERKSTRTGRPTPTLG